MPIFLKMLGFQSIVLYPVAKDGFSLNAPFT